MKKQGHYCKVCGEYKANEKFSGQGHAAHICKKCASLPVEERNKEMLLTRLTNLPWQLSKEQIAWLKNLQKDRRSEISEMATALYRERFPFAERRERKKQLRIVHMDLTVNGELYDEYGDVYDLEAAFSVDRMKNCIEARQEEWEETVYLPRKEMDRLLRWMISSLEIFCWDEDYDLTWKEDVFEEAWEDDCCSQDKEEESAGEALEEAEPVWNLCLTYADGTTQTMLAYTTIHDRLHELVHELLSYFPLDEEDERNE